MSIRYLKIVPVKKVLWSFWQKYECRKENHGQRNEYLRYKRVLQVRAGHECTQNAGSQRQHHQWTQATANSELIYNSISNESFQSIRFSHQMIITCYQLFPQRKAVCKCTYRRPLIPPRCGQCKDARPACHSEYTTKTSVKIICVRNGLRLEMVGIRIVSIC